MPASPLTLSPLTVSLTGGRSYPVHFAPLAEAPARMAEAGLRAGRCFVVTDENVAAYYRRPLEDALHGAGWTTRTHVLPPGEATKAEASLRRLYDAALGWGLDRQTPVLALGGGVVGDLAGFAAATLLRGLPLVQLPTSLVAQVDSSLGGKTGINHATGKNLIGAFWQPRLVLADARTLGTLPEREWRSGLAEVVKHALIADSPLMDFLETRRAAVLERDPEAVRALIPPAARVKAEVVGEDEREAGRRAILNFGHTFGHAVEKTAGYGAVTHGEAVALGMRAALFLSHRRHDSFNDDAFARALRLTEMTEVPPEATGCSLAALREAMQSDKKNTGGTVRFVLLRRPGAAYLTGDVSGEALAAAWAFACGSVTARR